MYAHITTYRLSEAEEVEADLSTGDTISDQTARTIASWWHSPAQTAIVALSHGRPFDTDELRDEIHREITVADDAEPLLAWLYNLELILTV